MARSRTDHLDVLAPPDVALRALHEAIASIAKPETVRVDGWVVTGRVGVSARSWGDLLTGTILTGPGGTRVTVESKARLPTQLVDMGKHRKNVDAVLTRLSGLTGPPH
ncbi:hypothetical protein [Solicola gregarius]|uniref:DUF1499 domain-containing protein n=1 Tax=Solicola gregarius TaxID=2908642 RepID=A0AA46TGZ1_9ACTN|nr:hypothetical protein [Solicola gregarius]UYM04343.1 hypothetical protein L0C25_17635 [Solicola gregarius]